jgi:AraC-like DNA-binding protein
MVDPLSEIVTLLKPSVTHTKLSSAAGKWSVRRMGLGQPSYLGILEGSCRLTVVGQQPMILQAGDFILSPSSAASVLTSIDAPRAKRDSPHTKLPNGEIRLGNPNGPPDVRMLVGHCVFASPDAHLLVSLLPRMVHVRDEYRLRALMELLRDESRARRPAREVIMTRLLEVLFIEALRSAAGTAASPGLLRGLADERLARAIRRLHERPTQAWTVAQLAKEAALSRSAFFERFTRAVGIAPMGYLLGWRMALAKDLLQRPGISISEVAERVGYSSASTFSVAFARQVGLPPTHYARQRDRLTTGGDESRAGAVAD